MKIKILFSLLLNLFFQHFPAQQKITLPVNVKKANIEFIISQQRNFENDLPALQQYLAPLKQSHNDIHRALYGVLYAEGYENYSDRMSVTADEAFLDGINLSKNKAVQAWAKLRYARYF